MPPTPDEVAAAADALRRHAAGESDDAIYPGHDDTPYGFPQASVYRLRDRRTLAAAWLAEHPADDGEPIDAEWLACEGFAEDAGIDRELGGEWLRPVPGARGRGANRVVVFAASGVVCLERCDASGFAQDAVTLAPCRTRGQLRRLLAALGVPCVG